jgi:arginine exporter protein ArgO
MPEKKPESFLDRFGSPIDMLVWLFLFAVVAATLAWMLPQWKTWKNWDLRLAIAMAVAGVQLLRSLLSKRD